ncbi:hypothetical protein CSUI_003379 [Cystoisospora suis]|uniref:Transmembrane protein n=1 Tax=Cystoisospora suis TaxID=483139 RepID=A0A2C6L5D7_9APIC|nr:hypothetical protein CSUI_003379 [Cystoisospora suis]
MGVQNVSYFVFLSLCPSYIRVALFLSFSFFSFSSSAQGSKHRMQTARQGYRSVPGSLSLVFPSCLFSSPGSSFSHRSTLRILDRQLCVTYIYTNTGVCVNMCMHTSVHTYVYILRERER